MNEAVISKIADAIAFAEGFFVAGSRPHRNNNPGDLERDLTSKGKGWDGPYVIYATPQKGWDDFFALRGRLPYFVQNFSQKDGPERKLWEFTWYERFFKASGTRFSCPGGAPDIEDGGRQTIREVRIGSSRNHSHISYPSTRVAPAGAGPEK